MLLEDMSEPDRAAAAYESVLSANNRIGDPAFWMAYGISLLASGKNEDALDNFLKENNLNPKEKKA